MSGNRWVMSEVVSILPYMSISIEPKQSALQFLVLIQRQRRVQTFLI